MNTFKGKVEKVFDVQTISERFQKREFVLKTEHEGQFGPMINFAKFQLVQEKCAIIDQFPVGTEIEVSFDLKGREWEKDGVVSYFTNIEAWKIEPVVAVQAPVQPAAQPPLAPIGQFPPASIPQSPIATPQPGHDQPNDLPFSK